MLGDSWGETAAERAAAYPCDGLIADPHQEAWRAIDVDAPAPLVWRWLCQLRVAPYSYDWIDNWGRQSPRQLTPGLDALAAGQTVMSIFRLVDFARDGHLTMFISDAAAKGVFGDLAVTYSVRGVASGMTGRGGAASRGPSASCGCDAVVSGLAPPSG